jgi:pyrroloquinoline quinone biosynthesis protein B
MFVHVLGSGAGGGFPQWNCNCDNCRRLRSGELVGRARTQSSIAVSANGVDWLLVNASPDIRAQLAAFPGAQPGRAIRDTGICAVLLVDAQIDHTTGLLTLREHNAPLPIHTTRCARDDLSEGFPLLRILDHYCGVDWREVPIDGSDFEIPEVAGLRFTGVPLQSEAPPYSPRRHQTEPGDNIGLWIEDTTNGRRLFYAPGLGSVDERVQHCLENSDVALVDGTVWRDDEMGRAGIRNVLASEMGHMALSGDAGLLQILQPLAARVILIHINNTNPILDQASPEHEAVLRAEIEIAYDGMQIEL